MHVSATTDAPPVTNADTIVVGVFEDEGIAHDHGGVLQALVDSGEAKRALRKLAVTHAEGKRYIVAGLGARSALRSRAGTRRRRGGRVAGARSSGPRRSAGRSRTTSPTPTSARSSRARCWRRTRYREFKRAGDDDAGGLDALLLSAHHDVSAPAAPGRHRGRRGQPRPRPAEPPGERAHADRAGRARPGARGRRRRGHGRRGDRGRGHGRVRLPSRAARTRTRG